jgi:hypothetical protein
MPYDNKKGMKEVQKEAIINPERAVRPPIAITILGLRLHEFIK